MPGGCGPGQNPMELTLVDGSESKPKSLTSPNFSDNNSMTRVESTKKISLAWLLACEDNTNFGVI